MVQSDTLSRQPDLCPDEDKDNEDMIMLPDNMFLNLINVDLQEKIAMSNDLDENAAEALKLLLEKAPTPMTVGLEDWTMERTNGRTDETFYFIKERTIYQEIQNYDETL